MAKYGVVALTTENNDSLKITNGYFFTTRHCRLKYTIDDGAPKVRDYHFDNTALGITLAMGDDLLVKRVVHGREDVTLHVCGGKKKGEVAVKEGFRLPWDFTDRYIFKEENAPSLRDATPDASLEIVPETGQEFHDRLMPFLHEAAWSFVQQAPALDHELRNKRYKNSELRVKLPIGYLVRELDRHIKDGAGMTREDTEARVREVKDAFTTEGMWYEHHLDHDVVTLARLHEKLQFVFSDWSVDLKDFVESGTYAANDFALMRGHYFQQALYHDREYITHRKLVWQDKE